MKKMLCLQDVSGVSEVDLAERLRIITGWKACRTEECERRTLLQIRFGYNQRHPAAKFFDNRTQLR